MQSTTGPSGGSPARVIYHAPGKSFAWLHKDGSFADFQKALRARLNISKTGPLIIKQIDGDYALDIETKEDYEAFCHFAKSASQLHISVNGGLPDQSKAGGVASTSSGTIFPSSPAYHFPAEPEDPTLGKRKVSQITTDSEGARSVTQKRKKRRKTGPEQPASVMDNTTITVAPPEPQTEHVSTSGNATRSVPGAVADQSTVSATKKRKKKRGFGIGQTDSTLTEVVELCMEPTAGLTNSPEPPSAGSSRTKKRKPDLSTVIPSPATTQEPPSASTAHPPSPNPMNEPSPSTTQGVPKKPLTKKKTKALTETPELTPRAPPIHRPSVLDQSLSSGSIPKPKPPVSKSGLPRSQVYVEIITKKRKTGKMGGSSTVEDPKQQEPVKKLAQLKVGKPKVNPGKPRTESTKRVESPNAPSIQDIMDGVIAAAMLDAKSRTSTSGTTTDVSDNLAPPPQKKTESMVRKPRLADVSMLEAASLTTALDASAPIQKIADSDSVIGRMKANTRKPRAEGSQSLKRIGNSVLVSNVHNRLDEGFPPPSSLPKNGTKSDTPAVAPHSLLKAQSEEESDSEDHDLSTPKKQPAPVSNPEDELDAFLHAPTDPSQKSILEGLPSDSEEEEEEAEREDIEVDEEDDGAKSKGTWRERLKAMARAESSSNSDSGSESVAPDALVNANQTQIDTPATQVSETHDIVPSSDLEDEEEPLSQPTKSTNTSTNDVPPGSSVPGPLGPHMTPISNLKSAGQALNFFNEHVLDEPDPIENDSPHAVLPGGLSEDAEDPIQNVDTASTPRPKLAQRAKGRDKTAVARKSDVSFKEAQNSITCPLNSMLPPPTPLRGVKGDLILSQPIDQSTPAIPVTLRKRQLLSQTSIPQTPARISWTALSLGERFTQSTDDPIMVDELISSPGASKRPKLTPMKKPVSSASTRQTPLFLPGTSQYPIPSSDLPVPEESSSEESEDDKEKATAPSSQRVLRSSASKNKATTPYRRLSALASERGIFPPTPIGPVGPTPAANKSQTGLGSDDDDDDDEEEEEDSGVSDSNSGSQPPSHIPKDRRAGNGSRRKKRSQLMFF